MAPILCNSRTGTAIERVKVPKDTSGHPFTFRLAHSSLNIQSLSNSVVTMTVLGSP